MTLSFKSWSSSWYIAFVITLLMIAFLDTWKFQLWILKIFRHHLLKNMLVTLWCSLHKEIYFWDLNGRIILVIIKHSSRSFLSVILIIRILHYAIWIITLLAFWGIWFYGLFEVSNLLHPVWWGTFRLFRQYLTTRL